MSYPYWQEISFYLDELDKEKSTFETSSRSGEDMDNARKSMAQLIDNLRMSLEKRLDVHYASLVIFAIVASMDEKMQSFDFNSPKVRWAPLQKDFYAAYTAGEVFFKSIDEILEDPNTPNVVFQVYYYMLKRGFQGKYQDSKTQISKYLDMLRDKIPVAVTTASKQEALMEGPRKKELLRVWHYCALSTLLITAVYFSFLLISNLP